MGTIIFVHGTGVRLKSYTSGFENAKKMAAAAGIPHKFVPCAWGDPLGVEFEGLSLPDQPPDPPDDNARDLAQWNWLFDDPLFELQQLTIRDPQAAVPIPRPGAKPEWARLWDLIAAYQPSQEFQLLLERGALDPFWPAAWAEIVKGSQIPPDAFRASAHELPEASRALARALIAKLHVLATAAGHPGPSRALRNSLRERLLVDWKQKVFGLGAFFANLLARAATSIVRSHRYNLSDAISLPIGDILLYQAHGPKVRQFIRNKIDAAKAKPIALVAHSLGGIACVDLLADPNRPKVDYLVTAGSQSPLLCEIGALSTLKPKDPLPKGFPPWLNLYDRNDFLSYVAHRLWPDVKDVEVDSGQPFPDSHSAYFGNSDVWTAIRKFIQ
jgi:hypothetical protein